MIVCSGLPEAVHGADGTEVFSTVDTSNAICAFIALFT